MNFELAAFINRFILFFMLIALSGVSVYGGERVMKQGECLKKYHITRDTSPWLGFTSSYAEEEESKKIRAVSLAGSGYKPIPLLEKYSVTRKLMIGRNDSLRRIAVEKSLFSDLRRGDATRDTGGKLLIGQFKDLSFSVMKPDELAEFLIESQIVNTYWHVESQLCLMSEEDLPESYTAGYRGRHIYFTNSENEEPLDFKITIEKATGNIYLEAK